MGKHTFICKEYFGELVTYGCNQMSPTLKLWSGRKSIDPIVYAELLEAQALHIRKYCFIKERYDVDGINGVDMWPFTVAAFQKQFNTGHLEAIAFVKQLYEVFSGMDLNTEE